MTTPDVPYRSTPVFTNDTLPAALRRAHCTKAGVWGQLHVLAGTIAYVIEATQQQQMLHAGDCVVIEPQQLHYVEPSADIQMRIDFFDSDPRIA